MKNLLLAVALFMTACTSCSDREEKRFMATQGNGCHYVLVCVDMGIPDLTVTIPSCSSARVIASCHTHTRGGLTCARCTGQQSCAISHFDGGSEIYCTQNSVNCYDPICDLPGE